MSESKELFKIFEDALGRISLKDKLEEMVSQKQFFSEFLNVFPKEDLQPISCTADYIRFFLYHGINSFDVKIYKGMSIVVISVPNAYKLGEHFVSGFYERSPAGTLVYFNSDSSIAGKHYTVSEVTLPHYHYLNTRNYLTLENLLNPPNSLKFIMDDDDDE